MQGVMWVQVPTNFMAQLGQAAVHVFSMMALALLYFEVRRRYEGDDLVTRGFGGDIARWVLPSADSVIEACRISSCAGTETEKWLGEPTRVIIGR